MPETAIHQSLSDTRGNGLGIGFFKVCMSLFGLRFCNAFVWFVAAFYALFDRKALAAATPYLRSRFPKARVLHWHFYRLIVSQGQALLLAHWLRTGHRLPTRDVHPENLEALIAAKDNGFIMLMSHVGCWQATVPRMESLDRNVNLLAQENQNGALGQLLQGSRYRVINNGGPFGGLLECVGALERHEVLCVMGDRLPEGLPSPLTLTLHGRTVRVPEAPWLLAARCNVPVFPVFTLMRRHPVSIDYLFAPPITIDYQLPRKPSPEDFAPALAQYQALLEDVIEKNPYQIFHYNS